MALSSPNARVRISQGSGIPWLLVFCLCGATAVICLVIGSSHAVSHEPHGLLSDSLQEQKAHVEQAYWENLAFDMEALHHLPNHTFTSSVVMRNANGFRDKMLWDFFLPHYSCPEKEKVGSLARDGDKGKWLCGVRSLLQGPDCIVYSFGSNGEMSFEEGIRNRTKCEIHVFDPTLTAEQRDRVLAVPGVHFHPYGLGVNDTQVSTDPTRVMGRKVSEFETKSLHTIMKELGHKWIHVLKIDIEAWEWLVLDDLLRQPRPLPFTQVQVEFHDFGDGKIPIKDMQAVLTRMIDRDLRVFSVEPNLWGGNTGYDCLEYAYIQVDRSGNIVTGLPAGTQSR